MMLQKIRDRASGPLAYIVVGVIAVVFGVWGIGSYFTPSADPVVASAAGTDITQSQLQRAFNERYQQLRQMMGSHFDSSQFPSAQIRQSVLNGLINDAVTTQYAQNAGYRVTDDDLLGAIQNDPAFQDNGQFSVDRYKAVLAQAGMKPSQYESELRQSLMGSQLQQAVGIGAFAAPPEVDALFKQANEQRKIELLTFKPSAFRDQVSVDAGAVQKYYQANKQQFLRPARVKLAYVSLDANNLSTAPASSATLHQLYSENRDAFGTPEQRSAEEIRIPIQGNNDAAARQAVQKILTEARKQKSGDSLKALAAHSQLAQFKSIDSQAQSALPSALGQALFGLDKGQLSNPVRANNAWYILRLTGITPADHPGFNDAVVQNRLQAMADQQAEAKAFSAKSQTLSDLAYQAPNGLKTISNQLHLPIQKTGWITENGGSQSQNQGQGQGQGLGQYQAVRQAAFSDAVLKNQLNSKVVDIGKQRQVVLRVIDHQPAEPRPLSAVADQIRSQLLAARAKAKAHAAAEAAMAKAQHGATLADIAKQTKAATLSSPGWIARNASNVSNAVVTAAFAVPLASSNDHGDKAQAYRVTDSGDQNVALVAVDGQRIQASGNAKSATQQRGQMAQQLRQYNAELEYAALDNYLRNQADVKIDKKSLRNTATNDGAGD